MKAIFMATTERKVWRWLYAFSIVILISGCSKFLDRKPLQTTLDDLNQGGLEGQIYGLYGAIAA